MTRVGSLCSGAGGLELGLSAEVSGLKVAWHAETDADASAVLAQHWPGVPNHDDIATVRWRRVDPVDVLTAGFPCQPVSLAGHRAATDDRRWLWPHVLRGVRSVRPAEVFLENVENIASIQSGAILADILADLRSAGYASRWCVLGACALGAAHHRHRFFLRAEHVGRRPAAAVRVTGVTRCGAPRGRSPVLLPSPAARDGDGRRGDEGSADFWRHRRETLGRTNGIPLGAVLALLPTPRASDGAKGCPRQRGSSGDVMLPAAVLEDRFGQYAAAVALWADVSGRPAPEPLALNHNGALRLAPAFSEWLMGLPAGWVAGRVARVPALRIIGNGVVPLQAAAAWRALGGPS